MADGFKILAQASLGTSFGTVYTVPTASGSKFASRESSQAIISSIVVCCMAGTGTPWYSIRVVKSGETGGDEETVIYQKGLAIKDTDVLSLGIGLVSGDFIEASISSGSGDKITMNIFGTEIL